MFSETVAKLYDSFVQKYSHFFAYKPNLMPADEAHPPKLAKEEQLAVSVISVFVVTGLSLWAMLQI